MKAGWSAFRYAVALGLTVVAGWSANAARPAAVAFPADGPAFSFELRPRATSIEIAVRSQDRRPSQLTVLLGDRQASFLHPGATTATYRLGMPRTGGAGPVRIEVDPPASVAVVRSAVGGRPRRPSLDWEQAGPPLQIPPPQAADRGHPTAEASVDETDTYGLRLFGVPVRSTPHVDARLVTYVSHGDRLEATCWAAGDRVTNGFPERPAGAYTSDVWFMVLTRLGPGFVPDVRFSRRGTSDRLNLPPCPGT